MTADALSGDAALVKQAKADELAAFEELVGKHERGVYALARRILQNEHDAEDVTQQTFLSAVEHLASFREESSFRTWLLRIATHTALKIIRKRRGLDTTSLDAATEPQEGYEGIAHPEYIADWSAMPDNLANRSEIMRLLEEALVQLDEKHRLVFLLRDIEGLSVRETADTLGLSEGNVKVRLLRARLQLRERLTRTLGDPSTQLVRQSHPH